MKRKEPSMMRGMARQSWDDATSTSTRRAISPAPPASSLISPTKEACKELPSPGRPCAFLLTSVVVFVVLSVAAITAVTLTTKPDEAYSYFMAGAVASSAVQSTDQYLHRILLPVYALAALINEAEMFHSLPFLISQTPVHPDIPYFRNVTSICDDPVRMEKFNQMAATLKKKANLDRILINLFILPAGVFCNSYPLNNTEDFDEGKYLDTGSVAGYNVLENPMSRVDLLKTLRDQQTDIAGPLPLRKCWLCEEITVNTAVMVRVPVVISPSNGEHDDSMHHMSFEGETYPTWGAVGAFINWDALVQDSNAKEGGISFTYRLWKAGQFQDADGSITNITLVISQSEDFDVNLPYVSRVSDLSGWYLDVQVEIEERPSWFPIAIVASIVLCAAVSFLLYAYLQQKESYVRQISEQSKSRIHQAERAAKFEKDLNELIAHEVRNPLSAAMSAASFLKSSFYEIEPLLQDKVKSRSCEEDIGIVESSLGFINELLASLLDGDRIAWDEVNLNKVKVNIRHDVLEPVANMIYKRGKDFTIYLECEESLFVQTDKVRLQQVVLNLARDSAKFIEEGYLRLRAEVVNGSVHLFVEDSGPGIPETQWEEVFQRHSGSLDRNTQGIGIGMHLSKNLVTLMEGSMKHDPTFRSGFLDKPGTRMVVDLKQPPFTIRKPESANGATEGSNFLNGIISRSSHSENITPSVPPPSSEHEVIAWSQTETSSYDECTDRNSTPGNTTFIFPDSISILFVDDDGILRKLASRAVKRAIPSCHIEEASSGGNCLEIVNTTGSDTKPIPFDVIFVDMYMQMAGDGYTGTDTVRLLRKHPYAKNSIIVGLSANNLKASFLEAGADAFMLKPFPAEEKKLKEAFVHILSHKTKGQAVPSGSHPNGAEV